MPVVKGGSEKILNCFHELITHHGGDVLLDTEAQSVIVENGCARGIATTKGLHVLAKKAVVCSVPPARLYQEMIPAEFVPQEFRRRAEAYRFGRADMQIHIALDSPAAWRNESMNDVACIHITSGVNGISRAVSEADSGLLPQQATIVVGQPAVSDPSRIPEGKGQLWIQLQELPRAIKGDAAGEIAPPSDGTWTSEVAERYADRIVNRLAEHIPGLKDQILGRSVISPVDLQRLNCNLVGGDPYCGDCSLDQFGIWRPFPTTKGHRTPIRKLWHIGASTHPGPGLGGVSGFLAAQEIS
jgi:phytoene dehydrogenase-like protein